MGGAYVDADRFRPRSFLPLCNGGYRCIAAAMRVVMRRVEIVEERASARPWKAIDQVTRQPLLSLRDPDQLRKLCERLEWRIIGVKPMGGRHNFALRRE